MTLIDSVRAGVDALPAILTLRLLPFAAWAVISRAVNWPARLVVIVAYGCIVWLAQGAGATPFEWIVLLYLYGLGAGWAAFELSSAVRSRLVWFCVVLLLFWGLPVIVIRPIPTTFLLICWDFMLKAYSFRVDTRGKDPGTLGDFSFFLVVNPALVYRDKGSRVAPASFHAGGSFRVALGLVATILSVGPLSWFYASTQAYAPMPTGSNFVLGASRFCKEYAAHSGIASIQIGVMRQLGFAIPERYLYPFLARSPADFWRRWNTYVGQWARLYLFMPLALSLSRWARRVPRFSSLSIGVAVVLTFAAIGALHDLIFAVENGKVIPYATAWFSAVGLVVVGWEVVFSRLGVSRRGSWLERTLFLACAAYAAAHLW
jgi:hypothetical protein